MSSKRKGKWERIKAMLDSLTTVLKLLAALIGFLIVLWQLIDTLYYVT